jgi:hypothetical protein
VPKPVTRVQIVQQDRRQRDEGEPALLAILAFPFANPTRYTTRCHTTVPAFDGATFMVV